MHISTRRSLLLPAALMVGLLALPIIALALGSSPDELAAGVEHPLFWPSLALSFRTTLISLLIIVVLGTPLAWWLATTRRPLGRLVEVFVDLPIVVPPAVLGVGLLEAFGRRGLLGPSLDWLGLPVGFSSFAVVLTQVVVAAPFFVQSAAAAFRGVDPDLLLVARTLGVPPARVFLRIAWPVALPGLLAGIAMAWARSLGEFGATLLFAGSLPGRTQTMPLAIYAALESDVRVAVALSLVLAALAALLLVLLRRVSGGEPRPTPAAPDRS